MIKYIKIRVNYLKIENIYLNGCTKRDTDICEIFFLFFFFFAKSMRSSYFDLFPSISLRSPTFPPMLYASIFASCGMIFFLLLLFIKEESII